MQFGQGCIFVLFGFLSDQLLKKCYRLLTYVKPTIFTNTTRHQRKTSAECHL